MRKVAENVSGSDGSFSIRIRSESRSRHGCRLLCFISSATRSYQLSLRLFAPHQQLSLPHRLLAPCESTVANHAAQRFDSQEEQRCANCASGAPGGSAGADLLPLLAVAQPIKRKSA